MVRGPWQTIQPARRAWKVWKTWGWKQSEHAATRVASEGISWSMERASVRPDIWSREATPGYPVRADGPLMHQWRLLRKSERLVRGYPVNFSTQVKNLRRRQWRRRGRFPEQPHGYRLGSR